MTIFQPHKTRIKAMSILIALLVVFVLLTSWALMFFYNQFVNMHHDLSSLQDSIQKAQLVNAELKNNIYQITDSKNLEAVAAKEALVTEKNPKYFENNPPRNSQGNLSLNAD